MIKAGMDPHDQAAATAVVNMLKGNTPSLFEAVTGNPTKLNSLIAGMAKR